jgi:hypothetical protein
MENLTNETIAAWLTELGPILPAAEIRQAAPDQWFIVYDEFLIIDIEFLPDAAKLVLSTDLGRALVGEENATYTLLLQVNALWRETGGLRMALDAGDGELSQVYDIALAGLDRDGLELRVQNFAAAARGWREVIATKSAAKEDSPSATTHLTRV